MQTVYITYIHEFPSCLMQAREGSKGTTHQAFLHVHGMEWYGAKAYRSFGCRGHKDDGWSLRR